MILTALTKRTKHPAPSAEYIRWWFKNTTSPSQTTLEQLFRDPSPQHLKGGCYQSHLGEKNGGQETTAPIAGRSGFWLKGQSVFAVLTPSEKRNVLLRGKPQRVRVNANLSDVLLSSDASPQGCVLSPLFYLSCTQRSAEAIVMDTALLNLPMTQSQCLSSAQQQ